LLISLLLSIHSCSFGFAGLGWGWIISLLICVSSFVNIRNYLSVIFTRAVRFILLLDIIISSLGSRWLLCVVERAPRATEITFGIQCHTKVLILFIFFDPIAFIVLELVFANLSAGIKSFFWIHWTFLSYFMFVMLLNFGRN